MMKRKLLTSAIMAITCSAQAEQPKNITLEQIGRFETGVFKTGDTMEQVTALIHPDDFDSTNGANDSFDDRGDNEGSEPEGVTIGKFKGRDYAFVGMERIGGVMIFDVSDPKNPRYVSYTNNRDFLVEDIEKEDADTGP